MTENKPETKASPGFKIWVDADACPNAVKEILFRTAKRREIETILIANGGMRIPKSDFIRMITVPHGANLADQKIVDLLSPGDLVITADIPLAFEVFKKGGTSITPRGQVLDENTIHSRLASRDLMEQLRSAGVETGGPKPQSQKDVTAFANLLDRTITRILK